MSTNTQETEVVLKVNSQQAQQKLQQLEDQAKSLRKEFTEAFKNGDTRGISEVNKKLQQVNKEMNNLRTNAANIKAAMVRLDEASPRELQRTIKMINNELNSGRVRRGSKEWDEYIGKLKEAQSELRKVKAEMAVDSDNSGPLDQIKEWVNGWGATAAAAMGAFAGVTMAGKAAVQAYSDMEAEEANVRKFTGMTAEEVAKLNNEFKTMDTRTAREDLNKLAQEAGRLGKNSVEDVMGFVRAADQINVALDDLGDGATLTLSKLTGIFGDEKVYGTEQSLLKVGSVINELSQNCSASAPYLAEFSSRIGGIAAQSNMTISQVMAFAAVLDTQNLAVEASSTAVGQLITKIYQEPAEIAKAARLDVAEFSKMVKTDMNGALVMLFEHLNKFGGMENLASVFDEMGTDGARAIPVLTALAGHVEELKNQQEEAARAFREGISVTNEFAVQNNTVEAQLDKARKGFNEMAVSLGEELLPVMRHCISGTTLLMRTMSVLVNFLKDNIAVIGATAYAYATYRIIIGYTTIESKALLAIETATNAARKIGKVTLLAYQVVLNTFTGNLTRAAVAQRALNIAMGASGWGILIGVVGTITALISSYIGRANEAKQKEEELAAERRKNAAALQDITDLTKKNAAEELGSLKALYKVATDDNAKRTERLNAVNALRKAYPDYFGKLSNEIIMTGQAAAQYNLLAQSIRDVAKAKAAEEKIKENQGKVIDLEIQRDSIYDKQSSLKDKANQELNNLDKLKSLRGSKDKPKNLEALIKLQTKHYRDAVRAYQALDKDIAEVDKQISDYDSAIEALEKKHNASASVIAQKAAEATPTTPEITLGETEKERKEREKKEREAAKKAREALKKELDEAKSLRDTAEAQNIARYATGLIDFRKYSAEKERVEKEYVDNVVEIHEKHDKIDIAAYGAALKSRMELLKKHQDEQRKFSLQQLDKDHREKEDKIVADFYDPSSSVFQNERALNQSLLQEDLRYLKRKKDCYAKGSQEAADIQKQIDDRLAQDKLAKQKETAEAYAAFEKQYRQSSGSQREKLEIEILDNLHAQGLISEEEYQRALADIKDKYRKEDAEKNRTIQSEQFDMVNNLYTSFSDLFKNLGKEGADFWGDLSEAAQAAFAVMGAMLSQYSAYNDAERDLELAKIQQRYDREIEAAGNNEKKKAALEKQRDAELAKTKSKYNDRAMKIEIAQALAQTAMNAIAAYGAGLQVGGMAGLILAPIAAAMATAAGMIQIATIKKQHEAQAAGYYSGGFTDRDPDNRREVGVVHANEFVANHKAVANPALSPVLSLIDRAQRTNTVGSLTAADVSNALGQGRGVSARGEVAATYPVSDPLLAGTVAAMADTSAATRRAIDRLSDNLEGGIETFVIMDGEQGLHKKLKHYERLIQNPKR